jgi:hypothetical protein
MKSGDTSGAFALLVLAKATFKELREDAAT